MLSHLGRAKVQKCDDCKMPPSWPSSGLSSRDGCDVFEAVDLLAEPLGQPTEPVVDRDGDGGCTETCTENERN